MAILPFSPGPPQPPQQPPSDPLAPKPPIALPDEGRGSRDWWKKNIAADVERLQLFKPEWDANVRAYRAKTLFNKPSVDTVVVPRDFSYVEQKSSQLFFQVPEIHLTSLQDGLDAAVPIFQAVINKYLSEDEIDALATMNEVLFDALCPAGLMCSVIGYENFVQGTSQIPIGEEPDPTVKPMDALPGAVLNIGTPPPAPPMVPKLETVPNIVHQRYFWSRFSPAAAIIPSTFSGSRYDLAPYLEYRFEDEWSVIRKRYRLPDDMKAPHSKAIENSELKLAGEPAAGTTRVAAEKVSGVAVWYRAAWFDASVAHPERFRELVLLDGLDEPLVHRDSPYQTTNEHGVLIGMMGNPVHIGALRYVSDTAYPPSECSVGRNTADELNKSRTQMLLTRDRSRPMRFADLGRLGGETGLEKIRKNIDQAIIPLETYDPNNPPVGVVGLAHYPQEDFQFNEVLGGDLDTVWGLSGSQRGQQQDVRTSATEIRTINQWAESRLDAQRRRGLGYFMNAVRKIASLIQMFATEPEYVAIVGADKVERLQQWDRTTIPGKYAFRCNPDSAIRVDQAQGRTEALKLYELLRKDPNVNGVELLEEVAEAWNLDPKKVIVPELPPPPPDKPNVSFRFNAADIDVRNPNFPIYLAILGAAGYPNLDQAVAEAKQTAQYQSQVLASAHTGIPPTATLPIAAGGNGNSSQPEHGGTAPKADHINQHRADESTAPVGRPPLVDQSPVM